MNVTCNKNLSAPYSADTDAILDVVLNSAAMGGFGLFGVFSNIINIAVFFRQGVSSRSSTVYLMALSVSDLMNCVFTVVSAAGILANFLSPVRYKSTGYTVAVLLGSKPIEIFIQTTCWITALLALERVVCVLFPFDVKSAFTPRKAMTIVVTIYIGTFVLFIPTYLQYLMTWRKLPGSNHTYLGPILSHFITEEWRGVHNVLNLLALQFMAIVIVALCNVILFWKVLLSARFRKGSTTGSRNRFPNTTSTTNSTPTLTATFTTTITTNPKSSSGSGDTNTSGGVSKKNNKDLRLLRLITMVSVEFTLCYSVCFMYTVLYVMVWDYWDSCTVHAYEVDLAYNVSKLFQVINSSTNFLIYYSMNARFKEHFHALWMIRVIGW